MLRYETIAASARAARPRIALAAAIVLALLLGACSSGTTTPKTDAYIPPVDVKPAPDVPPIVDGPPRRDGPAAPSTGGGEIVSGGMVARGGSYTLHGQIGRATSATAQSGGGFSLRAAASVIPW